MGVTNALPFFSNASTIVRSNIVGETVLSRLVSPIWVFSFLIIENFIKLKFGLFYSFFNYSFFVKIVSVLILFLIGIIFRKIEKTVVKEATVVFLSAAVQTVVTKPLAANINAIFTENAYLNPISSYLTFDFISNSFKVYFLSAIISFIAIIILNKLLRE